MPQLHPEDDVAESTSLFAGTVTAPRHSISLPHSEDATVRFLNCTRSGRGFTVFIPLLLKAPKLNLTRLSWADFVSVPEIAILHDPPIWPWSTYIMAMIYVPYDSRRSFSKLCMCPYIFIATLHSCNFNISSKRAPASHPSSSMNDVVTLKRWRQFETPQRTGRGHHFQKHCQALISSLHRRRPELHKNFCALHFC